MRDFQDFQVDILRNEPQYRKKAKGRPINMCRNEQALKFRNQMPGFIEREGAGADEQYFPVASTTNCSPKNSTLFWISGMLGSTLSKKP